VLSGNGRHGWREIAAVERFLKDCERDDIYLDEKKAIKRVQAAKLFRHTADKWYRVPFSLQPFQIFMIINIFGWYNTKTNLRRFQKVYLDISRKNGKTEFAAMLSCLHYYFENLAGSEVYFAATTRDQARIGFETAKTMLKMLRSDSARARSKIRILKNSVTIPSLTSKMQAVSAVANTLDGTRPSITIIDEYHAHPNSKVLKVMETGMINRPEPMMYITTTAGFNKEYPCYHFRQTCSSILKGQIEDDTLFIMIFSMDDEDDWENPKNWHKPNPNWGVTIPIDRLKIKYQSAKNEGPAAVNEFKTKNLNIYTTSNLAFISDAEWMANDNKPKIDKRMPYWGGLDLSSVQDLTSFVLLGEDGSIIPYFFCPQKKIEDRDNKDGVDYRRWHQMGLIQMIRGNAIDERDIKEFIIKKKKEFNIKAVCYDPWKASQIAQELGESRINMVRMDQNYKNFTEVIKEFHKNVLKGNYKHGGHEILRWNNQNVTLKLNPQGNMMFDKTKTKSDKGKIDGMVATIMAEFGRLNAIDKKYKGKGIIKL